jgi:hypothetical protein
METSLKSRLPTFKLGDSYEAPFGPDNKETLVVEVLCQRSWCQGVFVVAVKHWWKKNIWETKRAKGEVPVNDPGFRSRACPYCNNMHKMPKKPKKFR